MFNYFKKYLLIVIFLGVIPSAFAMENNQRNWRWPLSALTSIWSRLPAIPSKLGGWIIRKEAEKPKNANHEIPIANANNNILQILQADFNPIIEPIIEPDKISLLLLEALTDVKVDINTIKNLINQGADVNKYRFGDKALNVVGIPMQVVGYTALAQAIDTSVFTQDFEIIQELCKAGASITDINSHGETVFHRMAALGLSKKAFEIVLTWARTKEITATNRIAWLKEVLQKTNKYEKTAAQVLSDTWTGKYEQAYKTEILPLLDGSQLDKYIEHVKNQTTYGLGILAAHAYTYRQNATAQFKNIFETALNKKRNFENADAVEIQRFLAYGADSNTEINYFSSSRNNFITMTPIYAILYASKSLLKIEKLTEVEMKIVKNLLENKANPNTKSGGETPLLYAISCNDSQTTELLLRYGANVNEKDSSEETILACALHGKNCEIIQKLCNARASLDKENRDIFHNMVLASSPKQCFETVITSARPCWEQAITNTDILTQVKKRITWLQAVLQRKDNTGTTALTLAKQYNEGLVTLLDGTQLTKDYAILEQNSEILNYLLSNPAEGIEQNLAWRMAHNIKELNDKKMLNFNEPD